MTQPWLTPEQAAERMNVNVRTIQKWCRQRRIPHRKAGRLIRFTADDLAMAEKLMGVQPVAQHDVDAPNPRYRSRVQAVPVDMTLYRDNRGA